MSTQTLVDNMSIDELAHYLRTGSTYDEAYIYAARKMGNMYFTHKSAQIVELVNELDTIYKKFPHTKPFT